jgi:hypothetical protein
MIRIPNHALAVALVALLRGGITDINVTDHIDESVDLPYISIGNVTTSDDQDKGERIMICRAQLHIWSTYAGKAQVDQIAERIAAVFNSDVPLDLTSNNFTAVGGRIESYDTYEEDMYGYNGVINLIIYVQDIS